MQGPGNHGRSFPHAQVRVQSHRFIVHNRQSLLSSRSIGWGVWARDDNRYFCSKSELSQTDDLVTFVVSCESYLCAKLIKAGITDWRRRIYKRPANPTHIQSTKILDAIEEGAGEGVVLER